MDTLRKERNKHSRSASCWTVFHGMVVIAEELTESEADAFIELRRKSIVNLNDPHVTDRE
jgi:hypothetical protein